MQHNVLRFSHILVCDRVNPYILFCIPLLPLACVTNLNLCHMLPDVAS